MIAETPRLRLREAAVADAPFFLKLLNDPGWLANIGDRGVRTDADARRYIEEKMMPAYKTVGYGMWVVEEKSGIPLGVCGLVTRPDLPDPDLGFAFLSEHHGRGYAREAASAALDIARAKKLRRLLAIVLPSNTRSIRLLEALGFARTGVHGETALYARNF